MTRPAPDIGSAEDVAAVLVVLNQLAAARSSETRESGYERWRRSRVAALAQRTSDGTAQERSEGTITHIAR